jgi:hypothetical protein
MTKSETIPTPLRQPVSLRARWLTFFSLWIVAAIACEIFLPLQGATETAVSPLEQRLWMPIELPLFMVFGLAQAFVWPRELWFASGWWMLLAFSYWFFLCIWMLNARQFHQLVGASCLAVVSVCVCIVFLIRLDAFPTGG